MALVSERYYLPTPPLGQDIKEDVKLVNFSLLQCVIAIYGFTTMALVSER